MKYAIRTAFCCGFLFISLSVLLPFPVSPASAAETAQDELFFVAQKAFDDGFYDVSIRYIDQFLQQFPATDRYTEARLLLGQCYFFKNQYLKAFDIFQSILSDPKHKDATLYWMGETYFKGSDYKQAQTYYKRVVEEYPQSTYVPQAYYSMGWSFFSQGNYADAIKNFTQLINAFPQNTLAEDALFKLAQAYLNQGNYTQAIQEFERFTSLYPQTMLLSNAFFYLGESYYYENDFLTANTYYAKAAQLTDDAEISFMAKLGMGWIYLKLQKFDLAERSFDEAGQIARNKDFPIEEVDFAKGALYTETQQHTKALEIYTSFLKRFPKNIRIPDAMLGQANALYLLEQFDAAIEVYQKLLEKNKVAPLSADVIQKSYYGIAWSYLKKGDLKSAIHSFETIARESTNKIVKASALSQIADAYQENNALSQALLTYDKILKDYPDSMYADYAQFQQGVTFLKLGQIESAKISFQSLRSNFPQSKYIVDSNYYLGFAYFQNEEWHNAIRQMSAYLEAADSKTVFANQANYILALSYFNTRDFPNALSLLRSIVKTVSNQPSIVQTAEIFIGKSLFESGQPPEAVKHFRYIIQTYPLTEAHQDALLWLGEYHLKNYKFQNAVSHYQDFISLFPGSPKISIAFYEIGQCYAALGELDKAINAFRQVMEDADPAIFAKAQLAIADIFSKEMGMQAALEKYEKISETVPEYRRDAMLKIGKIYEQNDKPQKAITVYAEALQTGPGSSEISDAELLFYIADNYELLNNHDKAIEEYLKLAYLKTSDPSWVVKAYLRVARIFENKEQWDAAKSTYEKIIGMQTDESKYAQERVTWISNNMTDNK